MLCVDDDLKFLTLFTAVLEAAGYAVVATNDPSNALNLVIRTPFDLMITDYDMPDMNGAELACLVKQHKCDLPVILLSGNTCLPSEVRSVVDDYLVKGEGVGLLLQILSAKVHSPSSRVDVNDQGNGTIREHVSGDSAIKSHL